MEKKEMSFIEKFEKASEELEKLKGDECHMITFAVNDESEKIYACINGNSHKLAALLAYAALRDNGFKKILMMAIEAVEMKEQINNK